jgi:type III pantothenate kinase
MLLAIDVGNSTTKAGLFKNNVLAGSWTFITKTRKTSDEYGVMFYEFFRSKDLDIADVKAVIISSVVPHVMHSLVNAMKKYFDRNPLIVGTGIKTGVAIETDDPKAVGADRVVDIVAAYNIYGGPCIVIDFGTATTYDLVTEKGVFMAAVTSPGIQISADALWNKAAKLPDIEIKKPDSILATNTVTSMQAGLVYGYIGQTEFIVNKMKEESGLFNAQVIATGGYSRLIAKETDVIDICNPTLALEGLKILYEKNN